MRGHFPLRFPDMAVVVEDAVLTEEGGKAPLDIGALFEVVKVSLLDVLDVLGTVDDKHLASLVTGDEAEKPTGWRRENWRNQSRSSVWFLTASRV